MVKPFHSRTKNTKDDWQTPAYIVEALGKFDLDPCANAKNPARLACKGYTESDDDLMLPWSERVWMNPPYGRECRKWIARLILHGNGIALIPPVWVQGGFKIRFCKRSTRCYLSGSVFHSSETICNL